jgi:phospholipid/cholesterol/gamma-HCH transport system permease protein
VEGRSARTNPRGVLLLLCEAPMKNNTDKYKDCIDIERDGDAATLRLIKDITLEHATDYSCALDPKDLPSDLTSLTVDVSKVKDYDSYLIVLIADLERYAKEQKIKFKVDGMTGNMDRFIEMMEKPLLEDVKEKDRGNSIRRFIENMGERALVFRDDVRDGVSFVGDVTIGTLSVLRHPGAIRWKDFPFFFSRGGVNALPIVALITFLIGVITGYQGAVQLHKFGADVFLADLVTISLTRELAPLMTAIIVAGRSGSAYAAEIGTMKVSEEVDALKSMGFNITKFLILPRVFATTVSVPVLTIFADLMGIIGGVVAASFILDISLVRFLNQAQQALQYWDVFTGLFKSILFGAVVGMVGCFRGLQVSGGAESVGKYTTQAVVTSIFLIILIDAIFTVMFQLLGI